MARSVGYTCAIIAKMMLNGLYELSIIWLPYVIIGEIQKKGLLRPLSRDIYRPALKRLQDFGIEANTTVTQL
jgi:hypothetical protein